MAGFDIERGEEDQCNSQALRREKILSQDGTRRQDQGHDDEHQDAEFSKRIAAFADHHLFLKYFKGKAWGLENSCNVNLATLQQMSLYALQKELVEEASRIVSSKRMNIHQGRKIRQLMMEYCRSLYFSKWFDLLANMNIIR